MLRNLKNETLKTMRDISGSDLIMKDDGTIHKKVTAIRLGTNVPRTHVKDWEVMKDDLIGNTYDIACDLLAENGFIFSRFTARKGEVEFTLSQKNVVIVTATLTIE